MKKFICKIKSEKQYRSSGASENLVLPPNLTKDGKWHYCKAVGDGSNEASGSYMADPDGYIGAFRNFRQNKRYIPWEFELLPNEYTSEEIEYFKKIIADKKRIVSEQIALSQKQAAKECVDILNNRCTPITNEYSLRICHDKDLSIAGMNCNSAIVIPGYDKTGSISTLQFSKGAKNRFYPNAKQEGTFNIVGKSVSKNTYITETFETAITLHELTGDLIIVAFDKSNFQAVAEAIHEINPELELIVVTEEQARFIINTLGP